MTPSSDTTIKLPPPEMEGGKSLMQALQARSSSREFSEQPLPLQLLSNLLWAAAGINRQDSGKRTAPSARDWREIEVYVLLPEGAYRYEPQEHALQRVVGEDIRALSGEQDFAATAQLNLVYVADLARMADAGAERQALYSATDTGYIVQNVYLFCASADLATVARGSVNRNALGAALHLGEQQRVILAQSVGYPRVMA